MTDTPITYNVNMRIKANQVEATKKVAAKLFDVASKDDGILAYELMFQDGGERLMIYEQYANEAAFNAHFGDPKLGPILGELMALVDVDGFDLLSAAPETVTGALGGIAPVNKFMTEFGVLAKQTI